MEHCWSPTRNKTARSYDNLPSQSSTRIIIMQCDGILFHNTRGASEIKTCFNATIQHYQFPSSPLLVLNCPILIQYIQSHSAFRSCCFTSHVLRGASSDSNLGKSPQSHSLRTSPTEDFKHALVAESFTVINNFLAEDPRSEPEQFV